MEFALSQPKMVRLPRNKKQTYRLNSRPQMWPSDLTLALIFTVNFQGQIWNLLWLKQKCLDYHETKSKHFDWTLGTECVRQILPWPWPWSLIFKVKYGICFISAKNGPTATKKKHTDWTRGPKCDRRIWPWPWLSPWIFKVKYGICYNSAKYGSITTKRNANISIEL